MRPDIPKKYEKLLRKKSGREAVLEKCGKEAFAVPDTDDGKPRYVIENPATCKPDCNYLLAAQYRAKMIMGNPHMQEKAKEYAKQALAKVIPLIQKLKCQEK